MNLDGLRRAVRAGALPVLTFLGESASGQVLNINADIAARELVWAIRPHKIIFLTPSGGLLDRNGRIISAVTLNNDYEALMREDWVHSGMRLKLQQINEMLQGLDDSTSVSITSADQLTRELFTYRGAGTLVRKGEGIAVLEHPDAETLADVAQRVEASFGRTLKPGWAETLKDPVILLSDTRRAAAVVVRGQDDIPYLEKFIVTPEAQGEGLGAAMWQVLRARYPQLYWRSRNQNPITPWYFLQADTSERHGPWVVFCNSVNDPLLRDRIVKEAMSRDPGWEESA